MCLLVIAWQAHPRYRLIVAANRDEYHERPAAPLSKWPPPGEILAGRDLRAGGTWLGLDRQRRFAVVTNFRELHQPVTAAPSRGELIPDYLRGGARAGRFVSALAPAAPTYSGFNLLLSDADSLWYASNRAEGFGRALTAGVYGLSNQYLDTPWPKLVRVRRKLEDWLTRPKEADPEALFAMLADRAYAGTDDEDLPETGLPPEWEHALSAPFVNHAGYGTRCSTVLLLEPAGAFFMAERRFDASGTRTGETVLRAGSGEWP
ncbi:MAG TPA: NRDE family protein [Steroidobacteraceae bacterium]|nr:NRDE family protein [Steroidobacteraceae bacterium]